ncbi:MAG: pyridoxal phosphate-dependent class II aminotransferase [Hespellia sp.]|nr:pyridoxal phosphate-dependent class II aminotransferase [Hespellia sp.]
MEIQRHGGDVYRHKEVIDFSSNMNPLGTPQGVLEAARESLLNIVHYPDCFCTELRQAIAKAESVPMEWVLCGNGAAELLFSLTLARKPERALLVSPSFLEYEQALKAVDCDMEYLNLKEEEGFQVTGELLGHLTEELDVLFLCNPNNPTGLLIERELVLEILEACREHHILLVLDECFLDFVDGREEYEVSDCLRDYPNLFLLKAFTKRYAIAGIRLGYGLCSDELLLERMGEVTQPWNVSIPAQAAGIAALRETEYVRRGIEMIRTERDYLMREMRSMGLSVFDSRANYIFFRGPKELYEQALEAGFLIRDCRNYRGLTAGYYRIAVRTHAENERLMTWLRQL